MARSLPDTQAAPVAQSRRLDALDVLRALAALAVVAIHISAAVLLHTPPQSRAFEGAGFLNQFSRFAVPAFILITGAGLFYNYGQRERFSAGQYYLRRLKSLGLPYLFWSAVYFAYYQWPGGNPGGLLSGFLLALATAGAVYTFYFFPIIVPFYLLFPLVRPLARSRWLDWVTLAAVLGNGVVVWFSFPHPKMALGPALSALYPYAGNTPLWWMGPFFLGAWLACRWEVVIPWLRRTWIGLALVAGALLFWVMREFHAYVRIGKLAYVATNFRPSAYWYGVAIMLAIIGLGVVLAERGGWLKSLLTGFSKYSFAVYLVHPLLMEATANLLRFLDLGPLLHFGLTLVLVLGGSYLLARLLDKVPGGGWVLGVR